MPTSHKQSGFFIQASNPVDQLEMVLPNVHDGLRHYSFRRESFYHPTWHFENDFGPTGVHNSDACLLQSRAGYLEVVAQTGNRLSHYWKSFVGWIGPLHFGSGYGRPAFIQSDSGAYGNFEVVTPRVEGGLAHYWRDNDQTSVPWNHSADFGSGNVTGAAMILSNHFGNLEVVATEFDRLAFYSRGWAGWGGPLYFGDAGEATGQAAFIQSRFGQAGNFEVVVQRPYGGLAHYWRNNDDPALPWDGPINFGSGLHTKLGMIQDNDNSLIVYARPYGTHDRIVTYRRKGESPWSWDDPVTVVLPSSPRDTAPPPPPPTPPPANTRERFDFTLSGDWMNFITPASGEVFVAVAPPGTDLSRAVRYPMTLGMGSFIASVPATAGGPGVWTFRCHVRGTYGDGSDTTDLWSPVYTWDWQVRNPAAFFTFDSGGTGYGSWREYVMNN